MQPFIGSAQIYLRAEAFMRMQYKIEIIGYSTYLGVFMINCVERDDFY